MKFSRLFDMFNGPVAQEKMRRMFNNAFTGRVSMNKYCIIDRHTTEVVKTGLNSRQDARIAKRELEYQHSAANDHRPMPTRYSVETDVDHKDGAGIYKH